MRQWVSTLILSLVLFVSGGCGQPADGAASVPDQPVAPAAVSDPGEAPAEPDGAEEAPPLPEEPPEPEPPAPTTAVLAVCGDAMSHMPVTNDAWNGEKYDYACIMNGAKAYVEAADYAVVNLETTFAGGPNYSGYPAFNSPDDMAYGLKELGFDLCLTSNNHSLDKGWSGLSRTLDVLDEAGLAHVGTSRSQEECDNNIVVADVGGISVAFLGYSYGTNGIPVPGDHPYCINLFNTDYLSGLRTPDTDRLAADLEKAEALETDLVAVMIHWGVEYQTRQNSYQEEVADFLFAHGADIILGGHSHVPQPMEVRTLPDGRQGFVCFSLGNFISSQNDEYTDTTAVLTLELARDNETGEAQVAGYSYAPMYMLDREAGASPRFALLDIYETLDAGEAEQPLVRRLEKAAEDCRAIFGAEGDVRTREAVGN